MGTGGNRIQDFSSRARGMSRLYLAVGFVRSAPSDCMLSLFCCFTSFGSLIDACGIYRSCIEIKNRRRCSIEFNSVYIGWMSSRIFATAFLYALVFLMLHQKVERGDRKAWANDRSYTPGQSSSLDLRRSSVRSRSAGSRSVPGRFI